jgi:predicted alpha/beta superfamily hydrolase
VHRLLLAVVLVTTIGPGPQDAPAERLAIGETFTIESAVLGETRRINVYRAPAWGEAPGAPRPVLYMPDGGIAEDFLHVAGLLQVSIGNGSMRPFLLVGIENTERRRDMTGPTMNEEDRKIAPRVGGSAAFRRFMRDELMPQIHARYRTTGERAIVGESLAGLFVVETLFAEPELFDTYVAFDPSLWWNDGKLIDFARSRLEGLAERRLFLASSADGDRGDAIRAFVTMLGQQPSRLRWTHVPMPGETHATIYHPAALLAFRALFGL